MKSFVILKSGNRKSANPPFERDGAKARSPLALR